MTRAPTVSVVIVNHTRRRELALTLKALEYQRYRNFELIVVSDICEEERPSSPLGPTWIRFSEPNISRARNLGIKASAGEIVAFCDDDAVPEFDWLSWLVKPFSDRDVGAAGGYVRGRNGVSFQWRTILVDRLGRDRYLRSDHTTRIVPPKDEAVLKTVGTNAAFRRKALLAVGGFDESFRFFLDEADLNLRLAAKDWRAAIVPEAEVHHGFAASDRRSQRRVPRSLQEIAASQAIYLKRHAPSDQHNQRLTEFRAEQRRRLLALHRDGLLDNRAFRRLLAELDAGYADGLDRIAILPLSSDSSGKAFRPAPDTASGRRRLIVSGDLSPSDARQAAAAAAANGDEATLLLPEPTPRNLTVKYEPEGFFAHRFGLYGKAERDSGRRLRSRAEAIREEYARIAERRGPFEDKV